MESDLIKFQNFCETYKLPFLRAVEIVSKIQEGKKDPSIILDQKLAAHVKLNL